MRRAIWGVGIAGLLSALALTGCTTGFPWGQGPDPYAAYTVQTTAPLVAECQKQMTASLGGLSPAPVGGPTVTRAGSTIVIRLAAEPTGTDTLHDTQYSCTFENDKLVSAAQVH